MKIIKTEKYKEAQEQPSKMLGSAKKWQTAKVFTKAPGFGEGRELEEDRVITVRPEENEHMALKREGFDPQKSRIEIIDF